MAEEEKTAITPDEALLWAIVLKGATDIIAALLNRKVDITKLDEAIANEEVRSKMLERQRH